MKAYQFTARIERDKETGYYFGYIPNLPGAYTQGETLDELRENLQEVAELVLESLSVEETAALDSDFIGTQEVRVSL
jgi:predicted RNase H-like HicB family nuclease